LLQIQSGTPTLLQEEPRGRGPASRDTIQYADCKLLQRGRTQLMGTRLCQCCGIISGHCCQSGTSNKTVKLPQNFTLRAPGPGYTCGPTKAVEPTKFVSQDGRRSTQALSKNFIPMIYHWMHIMRLAFIFHLDFCSDLDLSLHQGVFWPLVHVGIHQKSYFKKVQMVLEKRKSFMQKSGTKRSLCRLRPRLLHVVLDVFLIACLVVLL
jgi:hypothetical protein